MDEPLPPLPTPYYQDSAVTIYHGDCRDLLPRLGKVGLVLTDPPYGENTHQNAKTNTSRNRQGVRLVHFAPIDIEELRTIFSTCSTLCDRWLIATMEWRHVAAMETAPPEGLRFLRFGVWVKTNGMPQISGDRPAQGWEAIAYMHNSKGRPHWKGGGKSGNYVTKVEQGEHPTTKPQSILASVINLFSEPGDIVLDPFMGGGSTLRAAKDMGRRAIGIEMDERWCEVGALRMAQEVLPL